MNKLSIIIPVYFNEDTLNDLYRDLKEKVLYKLTEYEIVFVNDGSGDNSWNIIKNLQKADDNIVAVNLSKNFGEHSAIQAGLAVCTGDCAVTKQADLQEDSSLVLEMYESWLNGSKVVLAARKTRKDDFFTVFFANIYYSLVRKFVNPNMPVGGCDCFLIDRQVIKTILNLNETNSSLILQVLWVGYSPKIIYFDRQARKTGKGRWTFEKKIKLFFDSFIGFSYVPIRIMWITGMVFFVISMFFGCSILFELFKHQNSLLHWHSLMFVVLISFGLVLWVFGILGEYIFRILDSVKKRPAFIIQEIIKSNQK